MRTLLLWVLVSACISGCVVWPHKTSRYLVSGHVFDNRSLGPVPGADVRVRFPESGEEQKTRTRKDGSFTIESDGHWHWIVFFWGDEPPKVPVELRLEHSGYDKEDVDDLKVGEDENAGRVLDTGYLYMDRKR